MLHVMHYNKLRLKSNHKSNGKIFEREQVRTWKLLRHSVLAFSKNNILVAVHTHTQSFLFFGGGGRKKWDHSIADLKKN